VVVVLSFSIATEVNPFFLLEFSFLLHITVVAFSLGCMPRAQWDEHVQPRPDNGSRVSAMSEG